MRYAQAPRAIAVHSSAAAAGAPAPRLSCRASGVLTLGRDALDRLQRRGVLVELRAAARADLEVSKRLDGRTQRGDVGATDVGDEALRGARGHSQRAADLGRR